MQFPPRRNYSLRFDYSLHLNFKAKRAHACAIVVLLLLSLNIFGQQSASSPSAPSVVKKFVYTQQQVQYVEPHFSRKGHIVHPNSTSVYVQDGTSKPKRLAEAGLDPQLSSDGSKVAFLSQGRGQIQVMNADGSARKEITNLPTLVLDFSWSPVGNKIAYCEQTADGQTAIVVLDADGSGRTELTKQGEVRCAVGMPPLTGSAESGWRIYGKQVAGGKAVVEFVRWNRIASFGDSELAEIIGVPTLAWSPDGENIAFTSIVGGKSVIGIVRKNGGNPKPVVNGYAAQWSPDGKQLLFRHDSESTPSVTSIWIANADGTQPSKVLDNEAGEFGLVWSPDQKSIVFASARESKSLSEVFRINIDGTGLQKIATLKDRGLMLSAPTISPDGSRLVVEASEPWSLNQTTDEFSLWSVDLANNHQDRLAKGSQVSVLWGTH